MRARGPRLKLGVELAADEPRMRWQFHYLNQLAVRREAAEAQSVLDEEVTVGVRHLVPMPVPFAHFSDAVHLGGTRPAREAAWIGAEAHRTAHVGDVLLRLHERDDGVAALGGELGRA